MHAAEPERWPAGPSRAALPWLSPAQHAAVQSPSRQQAQTRQVLGARTLHRTELQPRAGLPGLSLAVPFPFSISVEL